MALVLLLVMFALMWAFVIRPQQRKVREHQAFVAALEIGDEVVTTSGVYGTIVDLSADRVRLEIAPGVEITMARLAMGHRPHAVPETADADADADDTRAEPPADERGDPADATPTDDSE